MKEYKRMSEELLALQDDRQIHLHGDLPKGTFGVNVLHRVGEIEHIPVYAPIN